MKQFIVINETTRMIEGVKGTLGTARHAAYQHALDDPGHNFTVHQWNGSTLTETKHSYRGQKLLPFTLGSLVNANDDCLRG